MIAASPEDIPFSFQYSLDVPAAVGRLAFERLEDYERYARAVVAAETGAARPRSRTVELLGTANPGDCFTKESSTRLIEPLAAELGHLVTTVPALQQWRVNGHVRDQATREALLARLGGASTPAVIFVACHGLGFPAGDPLQRDRQGALVTQEWPGYGQVPTSTQVVAAADIEDDADVAGLVCFFFTCYGAGTPRENEFPHLSKVGAVELSEKAFVSRLAERLLAHPKGPALAIVGHVERVWTNSFLWDGTPQLSHFQAALRGVMRGYPIGLALEDFGQRYANLAVDLTEGLREPGTVTAQKISRQWTALNDARSYVLLGDPAVRALV